MNGDDRPGPEAAKDGAKQRRLAQALRDNLRRRKAQVRERRALDQASGESAPGGETPR